MLLHPEKPETRFSSLVNIKKISLSKLRPVMSFPSRVFNFQVLPSIPSTAVLVELQLTKRTVTSAISANLIFMIFYF